MKKKYEKPMIIIEDFSLDTTIAGDCEVPTNTPNSGNCGLDFGPNIVIFTESVQQCTKDYGADDGEYNGICYHVPLGDNLFNS